MTNNNNSYNQPPQGEQMPPFAPVLPQPSMPMSRRARWGKQLMAGSALIKQSLPDWFATYAIASYAIALGVVNFVNSSYAVEWYFGVFGIVWVVGFFMLSVNFSKKWNERHIRKQKAFGKKLFVTGLTIRMVYALFIYYFYINVNGKPYEFSAADSEGYVQTAQWLVEEWNKDNLWNTITSYAQVAFSDMGYPLAILLPIRMFDENSALLVIRLLHGFFGAHIAVLIYRLTSRTINETTARMAGIFCMLHPILICYVGLTLKEILMTWILVLFIDFADRMLRNKRYSFATIAPVVVSGLALFMFRTVIGMIAFMTIGFSLVMLDSRIVSTGKKIALGVVLVGILMLSVSENIMNEIHKISFSEAQKQQETSLEYRYGEKKSGKVGNSFTKYAGAAVFAPLIFTIPFPTMVATEGQEDMRLIHGGNWVRNVVSGFVILAMFMLLLTGEWKKYTLPLAMMLGYLLMLAFTQFAHSLRFHIPVMPFEMMFAAYAITNLRKKHRNWYLIWCIFMVVTCIGWNWIKLKGRGL